ncbi:hypothetical protein QT231_09305 [Halomonas sp. SpR1]|uniref:hypothetical protein n=1 Tax=Halomonas sp. SpR1 TaxID=3050462 RepID=UPI0027E5780A|nr:hypothetical protein [Halomonas sp. SpR1]MDQ7732895.1 hypothetical protein [Halomonas sp. SpR1]
MMNNEEDVQKVFEKVSLKINLKDIFHDSEVGRRAVWSMLTELLFLLMPLFLIALLLVVTGNISAFDFFTRSEMSLLATFIFSQSIIKVFQFPTDMFIMRGTEIMSGVAALVICLGVLPSAVLCSFAVTSDQKIHALAWVQPFFLLISIVTYAQFAFITTAANILKTEASTKISQRVVDELNREET